LHALAGAGDAERLARAANLLGLLQDDPAAWDAKASADIDVALIEKLIAERIAARQAKNFAESDRLRDLLTGMGLKLMDAKNKETGELTTEWEIG
jgi:cysteinyl-tRNA synthetase